LVLGKYWRSVQFLCVRLAKQQERNRRIETDLVGAHFQRAQKTIEAHGQLFFDRALRGLSATGM